MDSGQLVALIAGILVVLAIAAAVIILSRKRKAQANRVKAAEIRKQVQAEEFAAKEREATAARAEADALQAEVEAERLRREALDRQREAERARAGSQEQLRKADELDPDGARAARGDARPHGGDAGKTTPSTDGAPERLRTDGPGQGNTVDGAARHVADKHNGGERPRNL